ncbi:MAG TPA: hypothetical protein VFU69_00650, partial [Ktedonobacterales bacterium]|nr:hypothetical protein [Ktedonobacterales bacterium]
QPGYLYQGQPDYGYPYGPGTALPSKNTIGKRIALVLMLVVLAGGGVAAWFLYFSPNHSNSLLFDRHGVPASVPLPNNLTFVITTSTSRTNAAANQTLTADEWGWKVAGTDPATVARFYRDQMPGTGWTNIRSQAARNGLIVLGCQALQVLEIEVGSNGVVLNDNQGNPGPIVPAPSRGSALGIFLLTTNSSTVEQRVCSGPLSIISLQSKQA